MIVPDTNVVSEFMRAQPDDVALAWLDPVVDDVVTTAITVAEIRYGTRDCRGFADDRERGGSPISTADAQIAAIVRSSAAVLATRHVRDFTGASISVVDPWSAGSG